MYINHLPLLCVLSAVLVGCAANSAASRSSAPPAALRAPAPVAECVVPHRAAADATASTFRRGHAVEVEYGGRWFPARVLDVVGTDEWQIAYDGWAADWNERVGPARIREPMGRELGEPPGFSVRQPSRLASNAPVLVRWRGNWYPAHTRSKVASDRVRVRYDGYGDRWDETVELERVRLYVER